MTHNHMTEEPIQTYEEIMIFRNTHERACNFLLVWGCVHS